MSVTRFPGGVTDVLNGVMAEVRGPSRRRQIRTFTDFNGDADPAAQGVTQSGEYRMADITWGYSTELPGGWLVVGSTVGSPMIVRSFIPLFTLSPIFEPQQVAAEIRFGANRLNGITAQWGFSDEDDPASPNPIQNGLMLELANSDTANLVGYLGGVAVFTLPVTLPTVEVLGNEYVSVGILWDGTDRIKVLANNEVLLNAKVPAGAIPGNGILLYNVLRYTNASVVDLEVDYMIATQQRALSV